MHLIPSRQGRPSDDPIFSLAREATQRKARGEDVLNATIGVLLQDDGQLAVLPTVTRVVHEVPAVEWATYAPIAGSPDFLRAVIHDLLGRDSTLASTAVAVATPGGSGALRHAIANFLERGQAALTTSWFWAPYETLCDESDRRLETFEMFDARGQLDVGALDAAITRQLRSQGRVLFFLTDPGHNPTGYSMNDDDWRRVVECLGARAAEGPVTVVVDCAYMLFGPRDPRPDYARLAPLVGKATVLFAWSASKSFTHYGLRVGALVACVADAKERRMVESALAYSCRGTWSNCNRGGLAAIARLLTDPEVARQSTTEREALKATLKARVDAFNRLAHGANLRYPRYDGGFFVTVFDDRANDTARAMREKGVFVVPQVRPDGRGALRVALCAVAERDVPRLVEALSRP